MIVCLLYIAVAYMYVSERHWLTDESCSYGKNLRLNGWNLRETSHALKWMSWWQSILAQWGQILQDPLFFGGDGVSQDSPTTMICSQRFIFKLVYDDQDLWILFRNTQQFNLCYDRMPSTDACQCLYCCNFVLLHVILWYSFQMTYFYL